MGKASRVSELDSRTPRLAPRMISGSVRSGHPAGPYGSGFPLTRRADPQSSNLRTPRRPPRVLAPKCTDLVRRTRHEIGSALVLRDAPNAIRTPADRTERVASTGSRPARPSRRDCREPYTQPSRYFFVTSALAGSWLETRSSFASHSRRRPERIARFPSSTVSVNGPE